MTNIACVGHSRILRLQFLLVVTNLALSVITAAVANFGNNERLGLFFLLAMPSWLTALFGIMALDLFTYFAHVLMHKTSLGWRFHRVHHSDKYWRYPAPLATMI